MSTKIFGSKTFKLFSVTAFCIPDPITTEDPSYKSIIMMSTINLQFGFCSCIVQRYFCEDGIEVVFQSSQSYLFKMLTSILIVKSVPFSSIGEAKTSEKDDALKEEFRFQCYCSLFIGMTFSLGSVQLLIGMFQRNMK